MNDLSLRLYWENRPQNIDSVAYDILEYKKILTKFDSGLFGKGHELAMSRKSSLSKVVSFDFEKIKKKLSKEYKRDMNEKNISSIGFHVEYYNEINENPLSFGLTAGDDRANLINLSIPVDYIPENINLIKLINELVNYFHPEDGIIDSRYLKSNSILREANKEAINKIGWFIYTNDENKKETKFLTPTKLDIGWLYVCDVKDPNKEKFIKQIDEDCKLIFDL